ncbi:hypothetical protein [Sandaracinobacteroides saxicola]|uniref:Lipoprotein n=1 Tax=Sandaracinobacteroides saxicola TaxID=2759707 RepID=A0A7G5IF85_9SPHN|nr:hypothetical protein [Sandaracinobacteroides saxicola]QMW22027.1 hypothetical protein H3309_11680 [Sandaracinobacteroides saxicola]
MKRVLMTGLALVLLAGCTATKEMRVRSALQDAGMPPSQAACMARPLAEQLSVEQLRQLQSLVRMGEAQARALPPGELAARLGRVLDGPTLAVVLRAGFGCALRG